VNVLIGGYDKKINKPVLNWIDYLAANVTLPYAAHGHASYYVLSLLDRHHKPGLTLEEGLELLQLCVDEIKRRIPIDFKGIQVSSIEPYRFSLFVH
jgi:20S proteasome subunit beta 4